NYRNFQKWAGTKKCFMPVWTWDEISASKKLFGIWGGIPRVVLQKASTEAIRICDLDMIVKILGDVVDPKLKKDEGNKWMGRMEGAIRICDLDMIVKIIRDVVDPRLEVNNKTVHIYTNVPDEEQDNVDNNTMDVCKELDDSLFPSYSQQLVLFASTYISEKVINCYEEEKRDQMYSFLLASKDQMGYETLQGKIFEVVAHRIL
ncbi:14423_t:CDS:2, partial [Entrophospora sp. SA101]